MLFDEPELHLNPRLVRGLARFYERQLGRPFGNQIWLLTHSDVLLRDALTSSDCSVYHMLPGSRASSSQVVPISQGDALEVAVIDLVGESAAYRPREKIAIFEGGGDSEFDVFMAISLFPSLSSAVNAISGNNKIKVRELHRLLQKAKTSGAINFSVFSVVDSDSDPEDSRAAEELRWDVYHIENYLVVSKFVLAALVEALAKKCPFTTEAEVEAALRTAASDASVDYIRVQLTKWADQKMFGCLKLGSDPDAGKMVASLVKSIESSSIRVAKVVETELTSIAVEEKLAELHRNVSEDFATDRWRSWIPGRDILKRFVGRHGCGISYDVFRNLIIARMKSDGYQPAGMKKVVDVILE